jgi:peptide/nickel transport system substrate-binding protein
MWTRPLVAFALAAFVAVAVPMPAASAAPAGQTTWAVHVTLAPRWLDPGDSEGAITSFLTFYAVQGDPVLSLLRDVRRPSPEDDTTNARSRRT